MANTLRGSTPEVDNWVATTMVMIEAAASYAGDGVYDPEVDGMLRRMRVTTGALMSALAPSNMPTPPASPMTPPPPMPSAKP